MNEKGEERKKILIKLKTKNIYFSKQFAFSGNIKGVYFLELFLNIILIIWG